MVVKLQNEVFDIPSDGLPVSGIFCPGELLVIRRSNRTKPPDSNFWTATVGKS